jgi:large subunit ribosomal protein L9
MEVILISKVKGLGNLGEKVRVKPGYSRNYLIPYGKAVPATEANLAEFERRRAEYEAKANQALGAAESRRTKMEGSNVQIRANASPEGKLFGSVGPRDVADAFSNAGMPLNKSEVIMGEGPIRHTGEFEVEVALHAEVHFKVKINVVPEA